MVCRRLDLNESEALHTASTSSRTSTALTIKGRWVEQTRAPTERENKVGVGPPRIRNKHWVRGCQRSFAAPAA